MHVKPKVGRLRLSRWFCTFRKCRNRGQILWNREHFLLLNRKGRKKDIKIRFTLALCCNTKNCKKKLCSKKKNWSKPTARLKMEISLSNFSAGPLTTSVWCMGRLRGVRKNPKHDVGRVLRSVPRVPLMDSYIVNIPSALCQSVKQLYCNYRLTYYFSPLN